MLRRLAPLLLIAPAALAMTPESFRAAYKRSLPEAARKELIVELARSGDPEVPRLLSRVLKEEHGSPYLMAWTVKALCDVGTPAALRVVVDLQANAKTPLVVRLVADQCLSQVSDPGGLEWMSGAALKGRGVRESLLWALARNPDFRDIAPFLDRLDPASEKDWRVRAAAAAGLLRLGDPGAAEAVLKALDSETAAPVRRYLLPAAGRLGREGVLDRLTAALSEPDARVRLGALEGLALRQLQPEGRLEALARLVGALGNEEGRLRADAVRWLEWATGKNLGYDVPAWRAHLQQLGIGPPGAGAAAATPVPEYFGIRLPSRRIVFLLDASRPMAWDAAAGQSLGHLERAKAEIGKMIEVLPDGASFGIVAFGLTPTPWKPGLVAASAETRRAARDWLASQGGAGWPDFGAGLEAAFALGVPEGAEGLLQDAGADTVVLVSNGRPMWGELRENDLLRWLFSQARYRSVTLHAVGIGSTGDKAFLQALAERGGGSYRTVD